MCGFGVNSTVWIILIGTPFNGKINSKKLPMSVSPQTLGPFLRTFSSSTRPGRLGVDQPSTEFRQADRKEKTRRKICRYLERPIERVALWMGGRLNSTSLVPPKWVPETRKIRSGTLFVCIGPVVPRWVHLVISSLCYSPHVGGKTYVTDNSYK